MNQTQIIVAIFLISFLSACSFVQKNEKEMPPKRTSSVIPSGRSIASAFNEGKITVKYGCSFEKWKTEIENGSLFDQGEDAGWLELPQSSASGRVYNYTPHDVDIPFYVDSEASEKKVYSREERKGGYQIFRVEDGKNNLTGAIQYNSIKGMRFFKSPTRNNDPDNYDYSSSGMSFKAVEMEIGGDKIHLGGSARKNSIIRFSLNEDGTCGYFVKNYILDSPYQKNSDYSFITGLVVKNPFRDGTGYNYTCDLYDVKINQVQCQYNPRLNELFSYEKN